MTLMKNILVAALATGLVACGGGGSSSSSGDAGNGNDSNNGSSTPDTGNGGTGELEQAPAAITEENYPEFASDLWRLITEQSLVIGARHSVAKTPPEPRQKYDCSESGSYYTEAKELERIGDGDFPEYVRTQVIFESDGCEDYNSVDIVTSIIDEYYWGDVDGYLKNENFSHRLSIFKVSKDGRSTSTENDATWIDAENYYYLDFDAWFAVNPGYLLNEYSGGGFDDYVAMPTIDNSLYSTLTESFISSSEANELAGKICSEISAYRIEKCSYIEKELDNYSNDEVKSIVAMGRYIHLYDGVDSQFRHNFEVTKPLVYIYSEESDEKLKSGQLKMSYDTGEIITITATGEYNEEDEAWLILTLDKDGDGVADAEKRVRDDPWLW
ncbi:hypothetical protein GCM10011297_34130 [Bacterioplanes sanyensis]|uniref:hypothetical protein n=1 Tax=Bacterioplanes sanyensis TaxID=1249553 RepID=UPI0016722F2A|nr:hypothetical protein [Bacterioplanes sanyensis]GGY58641.1 hypothetical protein GCM10011297_34130 [Bacterioplanes sanyensis]